MNLTQKHCCPTELKPHPRNSNLYGNEDVTELVELIRNSGWIKPIVCTSSGIIISGHRRWKAALELGLKSIPVEVRAFSSQIAELEALLLENANRFKTIEQKVREAQAWIEIEAFQAEQRKLSNLKQGNSRPEVENFPPRGKGGKTRDRLAFRVGLGSGRTYSKAVKVVTQIDEEASQGHLEVAQALREVLNEQSVEAAYILLKKSFQERRAIANLIVSGQAKSIFQARQMVRQNNTEFNSSFQAALDGFAVGDWVEVSPEVREFDTCIGLRGQVEQILAVEQQISVNFEGGPSKVRFYPRQLTLTVKAPPNSSFLVGDIIFLDINRQEAVSPQEKKWNSFWGKVFQIGETGVVTVDIGCRLLRLFPRDLKPIDAPSSDLYQVVERVLRLRTCELDEIEERMLDVIQRREWFTSKQLVHLENIEKLYPATNPYNNCQKAQCRSP